MRQWTPGSLAGVVLAVVGISVLAVLGLTQIRPVHSAGNFAPAAASIENKSAQRLPATSAPVVRPRHKDPFAADARSYLTSGWVLCKPPCTTLTPVRHGSLGRPPHRQQPAL